MARSNDGVLRNRRSPLSIAEHPRHALRFKDGPSWRSCSRPESPLADWMAELDSWNAKSPGFFLARPVILDLSAITIEKDALASLIADLFERDIRIMGVEGVDASKLGLGLPPALTGGRPAGVVATIDAARKAADATPQDRARTNPRARTASRVLDEIKSQHNTKSQAETAEQPKEAWPRAVASGEPTSLLIDAPVRSGQSIVFPEATSPSSARSPRARRSSPAARSTSTARCAAAPSPARTGNARRAHLLPQVRGRAHRDRRPLQDRRRHGRRPARPGRPGLARRRDAIMIAALD